MQINGESFETALEIQGQINYRSVLNFKDNLKVGDVLLIPLRYLPYEVDNFLPTSMFYKVVAKYHNVVQLQHKVKNWKWEKTLTHSPSYLQLWWLINHKRAKWFKGV